MRKSPPSSSSWPIADEEEPATKKRTPEKRPKVSRVIARDGRNDEEEEEGKKKKIEGREAHLKKIGRLGSGCGQGTRPPSAGKSRSR